MKVIEYLDAVNKTIKEKENIGNTCEVQESGNVKCDGNEIEIKSNLEKPISGTLTIENREVISYTNLKFADKKVETAETIEEIPQVIVEQETNTNPNNNQNSNNENNNTNNNINTQPNITNTTDNYIGYYADVDGNGTVDGVIYADLAHSKSGQWGNAYGVYSYTAKDGLKEYTVSKTNSPVTTFGTNKIITLKPGSSGNSRFYVMALDDFKTTNYKSFHWYKNAYGKMSTYSTDTSVNFGTGKTNTETMIKIWNKNGEVEGNYEGATQDDKDIWKHIQNKYNQGWYIPSSGEWVAFADYLANRTENPLTSDRRSNGDYQGNGNYDDIYKLSKSYWSSSQQNKYIAWLISFLHGGMNDLYYIFTNNSSNYVRLGITF